MPARVREIGPEVSRKAADWVLRERESRGWSRSHLSAELTLLGYRMSASTIRNIENGVSEHGDIRDRLITLDEASAFGEVFATTIVVIPEGLWLATARPGRPPEPRWLPFSGERSPWRGCWHGVPQQPLSRTW